MEFGPALAEFVAEWFTPWRSALCAAAVAALALRVWRRAGSRLLMSAIARALGSALAIVGVVLVFVLVIGFFNAHATLPIELGVLVALVTACSYAGVFVGPGFIDDAAAWVARRSAEGDSS